MKDSLFIQAVIDSVNQVQVNSGIYNNIISMIGALSPILAVLVAVFLTYKYGYKGYLAQKEYELVRKRYLYDCIDQLCDNIEYYLGIFRKNWQSSLWLLKTFRDLGDKDVDEKINKELLNFNFHILHHEIFRITPFFKLTNLIHDDRIFFDITQNLYAFVESSYSTFQFDILLAIQSYLINKEKMNTTANDIYELYSNIVLDLNKKSESYYIILQELLNIGSILEKEKFSFKKIEDFHIIEEVKNSIEKMKKTFH